MKIFVLLAMMTVGAWGQSAASPPRMPGELPWLGETSTEPGLVVAVPAEKKALDPWGTGIIIVVPDPGVPHFASVEHPETFIRAIKAAQEIMALLAVARDELDTRITLRFRITPASDLVHGYIDAVVELGDASITVRMRVK